MIEDGGSLAWLRSAGVRQPVLELLVVALFMIFGLAFYRDTVMSDRVLIGGNLFTDTYPQYEFLGNSFRSGHIPLWNPYAGLGRPFLADPTNAVLYPVSYLSRWFTPYAFVAMSGAFHAVFGAWATYLCARIVLKSGRPAGLGAGILFGFSGLVAGQLDHVNFVSATAWLPAAFVAAYLMGTRRSVAWGGLTAVILACQFLAGDLHLSFVTAVLIALLSISLLVRETLGPIWRTTLLVGADGFSRRTLAPLIPSLPGVALTSLLLVWVGVLALGLIQVQMRPFMELLSESVPRAAQPFDANTQRALAGHDLLRVLLPGYSDPTIAVIAYVGFAGFSLACLGVCRTIRSGWTWFLIFVAILGLRFAFGVPSPVNSLYQMVPGYEWFQQPFEWLAVYALAVALLAGRGLETFTREKGDGPKRPYLVAGAGALMLPAAILLIILIISGGVASLPSTAIWQLWIGLAILMFDLVLMLALLRPRQIWAAVLVGVIAIELIASATIPGGELRALTTVSRSLYEDARRKMPHFVQLEEGSRIVVQPARAPSTPTTDDLRAANQFQASARDQEHYLQLVSKARSLDGSLASTDGSGIIVARDPGGRFPIASYVQWLATFTDRRESVFPASLNDNASDSRLQRRLGSLPDAGALGLGAVRYVIGARDEEITINRVFFDLALESVLRPGEELVLPSGTDDPITSLQLVTSISGGADVLTGTPVMEAKSITSDGEEISSSLRAGIDTASEPYDVSRGVAHARPAGVVLDQVNGSVYGYLSRSPIGLPVQITEVRLRNLLPIGDIHVRAITLMDDRFGTQQALTLDPEYRSISRGTPKVYELVDARPRVEIVHQFRAQVTDNAIEEARYIPTNAIVVPASTEIPSTFLARERPDLVENLDVRFPSPERISMSVDAARMGWVAISDLYYPGWTATINGTATPVVRSNGLTRAVLVPAGRHEIELSYGPDSYESGLEATRRCLFIIAAAICLALLAHLVRKVRDQILAGRTEPDQTQT